MFGFLHLYSIILIYFLKDNLIKSHPFLLSQNVNAAYHGLKAIVVEVAKIIFFYLKDDSPTILLPGFKIITSSRNFFLVLQVYISYIKVKL
nr:MAG TPA: hypothetical protein [Caudoviricetes sp.]